MSHTRAVPYRSISCRIGTHRECAHSCPTTAPVGVPVVYETCACPCHVPAALTSINVVARCSEVPSRGANAWHHERR